MVPSDFHFPCFVYPWDQNYSLVHAWVEIKASVQSKAHAVWKLPGEAMQIQTQTFIALKGTDGFLTPLSVYYLDQLGFYWEQYNSQIIKNSTE